jgi:GR25 family glycosyltransferase involved in LPS biosynthesis
MSLTDVSDGYYITLNRIPYIERSKTFLPEFNVFYGFDKTYAGTHCHKWALGPKCTNMLKFVYANSYSHYLLFKHLVTISWKSRFVFIFEDDALFYDDWKTTWNTSAPNIPLDAEIVYLHHHPAHETKYGTHTSVILNEHIGTPFAPYSTTSYAITKQCVCKLIEHIDTHGIYRSFDSILNIERNNFKVYTLIKSICYENKEGYKSERLEC